MSEPVDLDAYERHLESGLSLTVPDTVRLIARCRELEAVNAELAQAVRLCDDEADEAIAEANREIAHLRSERDRARDTCVALEAELVEAELDRDAWRSHAFGGAAP